VKTVVEHKKKMDKVYLFEILDDFYEGIWATISVHKTKWGAWKAKNKFLNEEWIRGRESFIEFGRCVGERGSKGVYLMLDGVRIKEVKLSD
jgi:hypothetical protein